MKSVSASPIVLVSPPALYRRHPPRLLCFPAAVQPFDDPGIAFNDGDPIGDAFTWLLLDGVAALGAAVLRAQVTCAVELEGHDVGAGSGQALHPYILQLLGIQATVVEEPLQVGADPGIAVTQIGLGPVQGELLPGAQLGLKPPRRALGAGRGHESGLGHGRAGRCPDTPAHTGAHVHAPHRRVVSRHEEGTPQLLPVAVHQLLPPLGSPWITSAGIARVFADRLLGRRVWRLAGEHQVSQSLQV